MRLIDADALPRFGRRGGLIHAKDVDNAPTVEAIPIEWIKKHIENDRLSAEKAKNDKLLRYFKTLEICAECLLYDWEDENGKYKEFEGELWQD